MLEVVNIKIHKIKGKKGTSRWPYHNMDALIESVRKIGVQEPIWLEPDLTLINGAARIKACQKLGIKEIPATIKSNICNCCGRELA